MRPARAGCQSRPSSRYTKRQDLGSRSACEEAVAQTKLHEGDRCFTKMPPLAACVLIGSLSVTSTDQGPQTHRDSYPGLAKWLQGADQGHWWVRLLDAPRDPQVTPPSIADMVLRPLEVLVQAVRGASPARMGEFVTSRFRDSHPANVLSARLELVCAANLAVRQVPFAFGGKGEPDVTWYPGTVAQGWLEIHRGAFNVFDDFQQTLDGELEDKGAVLRVRLSEWPLEVKDRNLLHSRITSAIVEAVATGREQAVSMLELGPGTTGVVEPSEGLPGFGRVLVESPGFWPPDSYLASAAARLARKVNVDKAGQGRKDCWDPTRTALLIDISTARLIQLLGQDGLAAWLDDVPVDWEDLPFAGVAVCFSDLHGPSLWGSCRYGPALAAADRAVLERELTALGLPATPGR